MAAPKTLSEALSVLALDRAISDGVASTGAVILASGGITDDADAPPLLCASRELAVQTWFSAVCDYAEQGSAIRWAEKPALYRFQVTIANAEMMTHRVVAERYAVVCGLMVEA